MSRQNLVQVTEELPADESRRKQRHLRGGTSSAAANPGKLVGNGDLVLHIDVINGGVGAEAQEQPLHDVAHPAAAPAEDDDRILRHEQRAIDAVAAAGIARAFARGGAGVGLRSGRLFHG
ncbi:unnamed protein product [Cuscuta epithymum]|uniref:Uncharacterized protein n=1 Tax=Cuscuta epithymum TaxID=186058 RepID=A0AAV0F4F7_9ASTE|nr:unnamed protein product [Cuscuta epithymum]